jgi:hypothetical protein
MQDNGAKLPQQLKKAIEENERRLVEQDARNAPFARVALWMLYLPISRRQQLTLGRIYSFQCTQNKDGSQAEYRMSLANGARELKMANRAELQKDLNRLLALGFIVKRSNGPRSPATYVVDEAACMKAAKEAGY